MTGLPRLLLVAAILGPITLVLVPIQFLCVLLSPKLSGKIPLLWHRVAARLVGLKIHVTAKLPEKRPLMIVSNHVSWADIVALGSVGEVVFVAKSEIASLPGANILAKLQRTLFIVRDKKRQAGKQAHEITQRLIAGDVIVLFAEGTTGDGHMVLDFKSSLFAAAEYALRDSLCEAVHVLPMSIAYTRRQGVQLGRAERMKAAWTGEMTLGPHATDFIKQSAWDIEIRFGETIAFDGSQKRQQFAKHLRENVKELLNESLRPKA